ncbi:MAG: cytochrome C oxidase subunit II [Methylohalobius sp. ZOD2]|nr:cytochrome C oxidase subunit II [Methylothermaceae bacterium]
MHIDPLEKKWIYIVLGMTALFLGGIFFTTFVFDIHPPSNVETIDSARLHLSKEFAEDNLGVKRQPDGTIKVIMVAGRYGFFPRRITLPADTPITFRWASIDVLHGVHMPMTNMSTMVVPGYVSEITTEFPKPGDYPMLCNEYCGLGHDFMWSKVTVEEKQAWMREHPNFGGGES